MHFVLALVAGAICAQAGVIQGVVLEHASGRPLARTIVRLDPVPRTDGSVPQSVSARVGRSGQFVFAPVTPGLYYLVALRSAYFPAFYGQRLPAGRGKPIQVTTDSTLFAELRLRHKGALTGKVLDENGVGTPGVPVVAYRARLPLRSSGSAAVSDDRGVYRIHGLEPGKYWVRSAGHTLEDNSGWLPTFGPHAREVRDANVHQVTVDSDTAYADVNPESGALFRLGGAITCETPGQVIVTLSSETGRRNMRTFCGPAPGGYQFNALPSGLYEVLATFEDGTAAGFMEILLQRDTQVDIPLLPVPVVDIEVRRSGSAASVDVPIKLSGRRQDLSEAETAREITARRTTLTPGYWELLAQPPAGHYVESIGTARTAPRRPGRADRAASDWHEVFIDSRGPSRIRIAISDQAGQVTGKVMDEGKPVPGAPVFLWPMAESARRSLGGWKQLVSDVDARFHFDSLPPGDYRVLSSFDVVEIDPELLDASRASLIHVDASQTAAIDLALWISP